MKGFTAADFPWSQPSEPKEKKESWQPKPEKKVEKPYFAGVTFEVNRGTRHFIKKLPISPGASLKHYFGKLGIRRAAAYSAVYDKSNLKAGKLRQTYVPTETSIILVGASQFGTAHRYQRAAVDAGDLMRKMK